MINSWSEATRKSFVYSISEVSKLTGTTPRALRFYEEKGLISVQRKGNNGYRYFSKSALELVCEIKKLKKMDFSLEEIKSFLKMKEGKLDVLLREKLKRKLHHVNDEIKKLEESKKEIQDQLLAADLFIKGGSLKAGQRRILMDLIQTEILNKLKEKKNVNVADLEYLKREEHLFDTEEKREFFRAVEKCVEFARKEGIKIGPPRGAAPALLSFYALGWGNIDPTLNNLSPERFASGSFGLHVDVEFKNGSKFINYCKQMSSSLKIGSIEAFKLPILDIIDNVHSRIGEEINYEKICDDDERVLGHFRNGDVEKIFIFDIPSNTLLGKYYDGYYRKPGYALKKMNEYLKSQPIYCFKDVINIEAIFRPSSKRPNMDEYIARYPRAKKEGYYYKELPATYNEYLKDNYGVMIYHEDIIKLINEYTGWDYVKCNEIRLKINHGKLSDDERRELLEYMPKNVFDLLLWESPVTFCKAHSFGAFPKLIKATAVLKSCYKDVYYDEIDKWEKENGYSWGDFGIISNGVSLMQQ